MYAGLLQHIAGLDFVNIPRAKRILEIFRMMTTRLLLCTALGILPTVFTGCADKGELSEGPCVQDNRRCAADVLQQCDSDVWKEAQDCVANGLICEESGTNIGVASCTTFTGKCRKNADCINGDLGDTCIQEVCFVGCTPPNVSGCGENAVCVPLENAVVPGICSEKADTGGPCIDAIQCTVDGDECFQLPAADGHAPLIGWCTSPCTASEIGSSGSCGVNDCLQFGRRLLAELDGAGDLVECTLDSWRATCAAEAVGCLKTTATPPVLVCAERSAVCGIPSTVYAELSELPNADNPPKAGDFCVVSGPVTSAEVQSAYWCGAKNTTGKPALAQCENFGEDTSLGFCILLCDDDGEQLDCGEGLTCYSPEDPILFDFQLEQDINNEDLSCQSNGGCTAPNECVSGECRAPCTLEGQGGTPPLDESNCTTGYMCNSFGGGGFCSKPAKVCGSNPPIVCTANDACSVTDAGASCDPAANDGFGVCICSEGFDGDLCAVCKPGFAGSACTIECPGKGTAKGVCAGNGVCDEGLAGDGTCACAVGFAPDDCATCAINFDVATSCTDCLPGFFGALCDEPCTVSCVTNAVCDSGVAGSDTCVCTKGFANSMGTCDVCAEGFASSKAGIICDVCAPGYFGPDCQPCPGGADNACSGNGTCSDTMAGDGSCACAVDSGFWGSDCSEDCPGGNGASACTGNGSCNALGVCACDDGFGGLDCSDCKPGFYGAACLLCPGTGDDKLACFGNGECVDGLTGSGVCVCDTNKGGTDCSVTVTAGCGGYCDAVLAVTVRDNCDAADYFNADRVLCEDACSAAEAQNKDIDCRTTHAQLVGADNRIHCQHATIASDGTCGDIAQ